MKHATIVTDGSFDNQSGFGGWAYVVLEQGAEVYRAAGKESNSSTSMRFEFIPIIHALAHLPLEYTHVHIKSDLQILRDFYDLKKEGWKQKSANTPFLKAIDVLIKSRQQVKFSKIQSHSGYVWHDVVDYLSKLARIDPVTDLYIDTSDYQFE